MAYRKVPRLNLAALENPSVGGIDLSGVPPLVLAASKGDSDQVEALLRSGEDPLGATPSGWTALHAAAMAGHRIIIRIIIENRPMATAAVLAATTLWGCTPLQSAAAAGQLEAVYEFLTAVKADFSDFKHWPQAAKDTLLIVTVSAGWLTAAGDMLSIGADVNARANDGYNVLHVATRHGHTKIVQQLLAAGADANAVSTNGTTALLSAAFRGHVAIADHLLAAGANAKARDRFGNSALHFAAGQGREAMVQHLLDLGFEVKTRNAAGETAAHVAAQQGSIPLLTILLVGGDVDAADGMGYTLSMAAARCGHSKALRLLLHKGADGNKVNPQGDSALSLALEKGHTRAAQVVLEYTASRRLTHDNWKALVAAASSNDESMVRVLVERAAAGTVDFREAMTRAAEAADAKRHLQVWAHLVMKMAELCPWQHWEGSSFNLHMAGHVRALCQHATNLALEGAQAKLKQEKDELHAGTQYLVVQAAGLLKRAERTRGMSRHRIVRWFLKPLLVLPALVVAGTVGCMRTRQGCRSS
jgi:serine/threonine-protein phosphatase 6 regulatory ankyrin repeat subunit B